MRAAERAAWLRLVLTPGLGPRTARRLLSVFGLPDAIFAAGRTALMRAVPEPLARELAQPPGPETLSAVDTTEEWLAASAENALLTLADPEYPQALLTTADPPPVLFATGRLELLNRPAVAIVGSRNATQQGITNAEGFASVLARAGITVVSGLALGIDAAAHRGALAEAGDASTIAVVGTGVDVIYPSSHRALTMQIRARGAVVSEFPLRTPALAHNFPRRNRLIAGLGRGVLVVEAALRSGSLITARLAAEAGREVFAIPGSIHSPLAKGCHQLIREGAKLVESAHDVLEDLGAPSAAAAPSEPAVTAAADDAIDGRLLALLGHDPVDFDTLEQRSGRSAGELAAALLELELAQHIERLPGNRYQRLR
jgi:DNA processing protein